MTDHVHEPDNIRHRAIDDQIDAALATYAAIEPRPGLEERILANLRAQEGPSVGIVWWRRAGVLAAALVVITWLVWKRETPERGRIVRQPSISHEERQPQVSINALPKKSQRQTVRMAARHVPKGGSHPQVVVAAEPKLVQVPSPQPLSEQERILVGYVAANPERAVLLARLRTEALRQEQAEEMKGLPTDDREIDSKRNSD